MTLRDAIETYLEQSPRRPGSEKTLFYLREFFPSDSFAVDLTPERLRDFLSHWYIERTRGRLESRGGGDPESARWMGPLVTYLLDDLEGFLDWCATILGEHLSSQCRSVIEDARRTLPRALQLGEKLVEAIHKRGPFDFPGLLSTFEEGGRGEYDLDDASNESRSKLLEGYFRIVRIEGNMVQAEDLLTEELVERIVFPPTVSPLLDTDYVVELEMIRRDQQWQIVACGFAYPPGAFPSEY
jgi:hypothetical protein